MGFDELLGQPDRIHGCNAAIAYMLSGGGGGYIPSRFTLKTPELRVESYEPQGSIGFTLPS